MAYTPQTWQDLPSTASPIDAARLNYMETGIQTGNTTVLTPTAVKTGAYNAVAADYVPVDTTSASVTITLPTAPSNLARIGIKMVIQGGANTVTIACGGADVFNKVGGGTTVTLTLLNQAVTLQYNTGIWYVVSDDLALSQLDNRYGTGLAPTSVGDLLVVGAGPVWQESSPASAGIATQSYAQSAARTYGLRRSTLGWLEWTFDTGQASNDAGLGLTAGTQTLSRLDFSTSVTWTQVGVLFLGAGSALTSNQNFLAAFDSSGNRLGVSGDLTTAFGTTGVKMSGSLGSHTTAAGDFIYVCVLANGGSTMPKLLRSATASSTIATNTGPVGTLSNQTVYSATNGTLKTAVDGSLTLSSNSSGGSWIFAGVA